MDCVVLAQLEATLSKDVSVALKSYLWVVLAARNSAGDV
jgi:hypothetical protein